MTTFDDKYYDKDYFVTPQGKKCVLEDGTIKEWSYANPTGDWHGTMPIVRSWKNVFRPKKMLDVGAGRGVFLGYAQEIGIDAQGFDFSEFATSDEGRFDKCSKDSLIWHDVTKKWPYEDDSFDFIVCLDLMEHIYEENIDFVINELFRVASKNIFLQISTSESTNFILKKDEDIPDEHKEMALTGHVLIQNQQWWKDRLMREGWEFSQEKVDRFYDRVVPPIACDSAWAVNLIAVLEK
mgnify:CR=1 FL=1